MSGSLRIDSSTIKTHARNIQKSGQNFQPDSLSQVDTRSTLRALKNGEKAFVKSQKNYSNLGSGMVRDGKTIEGLLNEFSAFDLQMMSQNLAGKNR